MACSFPAGTSAAPGTGALEATASPACRNTICASLHSVPPANRPRTSLPSLRVAAVAAARPRRCAEHHRGRGVAASRRRARCPAARVFRAEEADRERLWALRHAREHRACDRGGRRLGDQHDMLRRRVGIERIDRHQGGDRPDLGLEVAPAGPDRMADAAPGARDQARHFLDAGARRADDADVAARHDVGEAERHAGDDRGAAIRPHHEEAARRARRA